MSNTSGKKKKERRWRIGEDSIELLDGLSPIINTPGRNSIFIHPVASPRHLDIEKELDEEEPEHEPRKFNQ